MSAIWISNTGSRERANAYYSTKIYEFTPMSKKTHTTLVKKGNLLISVYDILFINSSKEISSLNPYALAIIIVSLSRLIPYTTDA
jgi:hypothetical protein